MTPGAAPRLAELTQRAALLGRCGERRLLGITGPPGAGKSTLASALAVELVAPVAPMDGFHLDNAELGRLGRLGRKGAPDTFDGPGYLALLRTLRAGDDVVWAPAFDRERERTVPAAIEIGPGAGLVITEGNYLLLDDEPWCHVHGLLDEVWYLDHPDRVARLVQRHISHGWNAAVARARATRGSDADNAQLIIASRRRADLVLAHGWLAP